MLIAPNAAAAAAYAAPSVLRQNLNALPRAKLLLLLLPATGVVASLSLLLLGADL
jgi:hypothetical protein